MMLCLSKYMMAIVVVDSINFHARNPVKTLTPLKYWMLTQRDQCSTVSLAQSPLVQAMKRVLNMASNL